MSATSPSLDITPHCSLLAQGRFRGEIMLATFAWAHLHIIDQLPTDLRDAIAEMPDSEPAGALVMAALVVSTINLAALEGSPHSALFAD